MTVTDDVLKRAICAAYAGSASQEELDAIASSELAPEARFMFTTDELRAALESVIAPAPTVAELREVSDALGDHEGNAVALLTPLEPMRVTVEFPSYNERRYGLPWLARVTDWPVGGRPVMAFGKFVGSAGCRGECELLARPGDVVRWGQKDNRQGTGTWGKWGIVDANGTVEQCSESKARERFL